ncbi:helix-turn-helix domain-containing protein [Micromonospora pisi]|nr:helix-turn-helix transcriptional regulator [Micromonospora pisi]
MRQLRADRGLSLRDLAKLTVYAKSYIHELETGLKQPTDQAARRIDDALGARGELSALVSADGGIGRREFVAGGIAVALPHLVLDHGRQVGSDLPVQLTERTARLRRIDDYLGGADTYEVFAAEVESTRRLAQGGSFSEATGAALLTVLGEQAQLAGWAAFDAGRYVDSEHFYRMSLDAARGAGDSALAGNAMAFLAYQELALGRPGVPAATSAVETAGDDATPGVRALLHSRKAWAHAIAGQAGDAARHLGLAENCLTEADDRPDPDWVYWVDRSEMEIMTGRCWAVLHRPLRAISVLGQVLAAYDDTHARDKALYLTWLAEAYLDANEPEQACVTAGRAMRLSFGVGSVRPAKRLDLFLGRLAPYAALPCVGDLRAVAREWAQQRRLIAGATPGTR